MLKALLLSLIALSAIACSQAVSSHDGGDSSDRASSDENIVAEAERIYSSRQFNDKFYDCDKKQKPLVLEIVSAIEKNKAQIEKLDAEARAKEKIYREVKAGKYTLLDRISPAKVQDKWELDYDSWAKANELYQKVKDKPSDPLWLELNSLARSLIVDDEDRIIGLAHPLVNRESKGVILSTKAKIETCMYDRDCVLPDLNSLEKEWLLKSPQAANFFAELEKPKRSVMHKKGFLQKLMGITNEPAWRFQFRQDPSFLVENGILRIPLNLSQFGSDAKIVSDYIEKTWNSLGPILKVENSTDPMAYRIEVADVVGPRAYLSWSERKMQLFNPSRLGTIAHEFGHILGAKDEYYISFDSKTCVYEYQQNAMSIMSSSRTGKVLREHVDEVKRIYGLSLN